MGDISRFVESLSINPWLVLIAAACTIVAVPLAFIFYLRSRKEKLPRYAVRSNNIIKGSKAVIPGLTVHFQGHGEPIENLTVSKVVFWNASRETIRPLPGSVWVPTIWWGLQDTLDPEPGECAAPPKA